MVNPGGWADGDVAYLHVVGLLDGDRARHGVGADAPVSRSVRHAPSTTAAPRAASSSAVAAPIPLLAPVMATTAR